MFKNNRNKYITIIFGTLVVVATAYFLPLNSDGVGGAENGGTRIIYSLDNRNNDEEIIKVIDDADKFVYFAVYYFTEKGIAEALLRAKGRGVDVRGITDRDASTKSNKAVVEMLRAGGVVVETQKHEDGIMHMKLLVTDKAYASGSYNWTVAATEANDEVLEIGSNEDERRQYLTIVKKVLSANESYDDKSSGEIGKYDYVEAKDHIGEYAFVSGTVLKASASKSGTIFFNFCKTSTKCPFTVVIFVSDAKKFPDLKKYETKITVSGIIKSYRGQAEIVVSEPSQVTI